ncbi:MAG TPA: response regulator [Anaerolineales bacterium]|nr:response regulator [Anaerolineales bacterium]
MPRTYRVLNIEDDDDQFLLLKIALKDLPLELHRASNGKEALALLPDLKPDLLMVDVTLPDMRGWEVLDWLKINHRALRDMPVIVLTAHTEASHRVIAKLQEVAHYINKPFVPDELRDKVKNLLKIAD